MTYRGSRKRRMAGLAAAVAAGGVLLWAASGSVAQMRLPVRSPRAVLTETEAFVLGEAQTLAGPIILSVSPMPDGPFAVIVRNVPDDRQQAVADAEAQRPIRSGEVQALLWNRRTGRVSVLWRKRVDEGQSVMLTSAEWLPGSDTALLQFQSFPRSLEPRTSLGGTSQLLLISTRSTTAQAIPVEPEVTFQTAPNHPFALLVRLPLPGDPPLKMSTVRILRPNGTVGAPITLPEGYTFWMGISDDGTRAYVVRMQQTEDTPPKHIRKYAAVRLSDGAVTPLEKRPEFHPASVEDETQRLPVRLVTSRATLSDDRDRREVVQSVWLERVQGESAATTAPTARLKPAPPSLARTGEDREGRALITADGAAVALMPDGSAALYLTLDGTLMAAPIARHEAWAYREQMREMHRLKTMQNAKQIALGMLMYAQDYDETFPPSTNVSDLISPYIRNPEVFQNPATGTFSFRYAGLAGGKLGAVERPAETVLGYLDGPGGRAVVYVDGHVKWEDEPKSGR